MHKAGKQQRGLERKCQVHIEIQMFFFKACILQQIFNSLGEGRRKIKKKKEEKPTQKKPQQNNKDAEMCSYFEWQQDNRIQVVTLLFISARTKIKHSEAKLPNMSHPAISLTISSISAATTFCQTSMPPRIQTYSQKVQPGFQVTKGNLIKLELCCSYLSSTTERKASIWEVA